MGPNHSFAGKEGRKTDVYVLCLTPFSVPDAIAGEKRNRLAGS